MTKSAEKDTTSINQEGQRNTGGIGESLGVEANAKPPITSSANSNSLDHLLRLATSSEESRWVRYGAIQACLKINGSGLCSSACKRFCDFLYPNIPYAVVSIYNEGACGCIEIELDPDEWSDVLHGRDVGVEGLGYSYEGDDFSSYWYFEGGVLGTVDVGYDGGGQLEVGSSFFEFRVEEHEESGYREVVHLTDPEDDQNAAQFTSAGMPWSEVPEDIRADVEFIEGKVLPFTVLPSLQEVPIPEILLQLPELHERRPRGTKPMMDVAGAKSRLSAYRPGAWTISPLTEWKWAKFESGEVRWVPDDTVLPDELQV